MEVAERTRTGISCVTSVLPTRKLEVDAVVIVRQRMGTPSEARLVRRRTASDAEAHERSARWSCESGTSRLMMLLLAEEMR